MDERDRKLQDAVRQDDWTQVKELLERGADPDTEAPFGAVLFLALLRGHTLVARLLVEAGADVNVTDNDGWTPLHWAAKAGDGELMLLMVQADGDLLAMDGEGRTPFDILREYRHEQVLEMIRKKYPKEYTWWQEQRRDPEP